MSRSLHPKRERLHPETPADGTQGGPEAPPETESEASPEQEDAGPAPETPSETSLIELDALRAMLGLPGRAPKKPDPGAAPPGVDEN